MRKYKNIDFGFYDMYKPILYSHLNTSYEFIKVFYPLELILDYQIAFNIYWSVFYENN